MPTARRHYGWRPDLPDARDHYIPKVGWFKAAFLPSKVDLRPTMPPVYDQGELGSCVANASAAAIQFQRAKEGLSDFVPSRLFIYYNARVIEGDPVDQDTGLQVRNGIKAIATQGACPETEWAYNAAKFKMKPPARCYADAKSDVAVEYERVDQTLSAMKAVLAAGNPFIFGVTVYDSFEGQDVAGSGVVPMPNIDSESVVGGHCMMAVGYDDAEHAFIVRNSWSAGWGKAGYCFVPYAYLTSADLADDFWVVKTIGGGA